MMGTARCVLAFSVLLLGACGGPPVVGDSRGPFDTTTGLYGGNEFSPLTPEGHRVFKGDKSDAPQPAPVAATTPGVVLAAAPVVPASPVRVDIDANAYGAVFGNTPAPVKPTPAQLMQLDSLSLMAAEPLRVDLQKRILECRRAGDNCRMVGR